MNEQRKAIFGKIKKCMALSASSNEHEAEAALRQARALMEKYGIDNEDVLAYEACEEHAKSGSKRKPVDWEGALASKVAESFGCRIIFKSSGFFNDSGRWCFIGCGAAPEISAYAFQVLHRQCKRARTEHISTKLNRCKQATKTRRADLFCEGWISAVAGKIAALAGNEQQTRAIEAYIAKNYPSLRSLSGRNRNDGRNISGRELDDVAAGMRSGKNAELNRGVNGATAPLGLE
jgi:hypothetical protein